VLLTATLARFDLSRIAFAAAVAVLAAGPIIWLINTWRDPAFDSHGFAYFSAVVALAAWSATSAPQHRAGVHDERIAIVLLAATAFVRLAGQVLAIDTIGALALVIDVYALARLAGLDRRARAISPLWLAFAFAFALPLERIVQRSIGYVLQDVSAQGACATLSALFSEVQCAGVRITVSGADVLVDLPCSGARAIIVFAFVFAVAAALARPGLRMALLGGALALAAALAGNVLRITLLASGVAIGPDQLGFDVMTQPWHDLVGLVALGVAAPVLVLWARGVKPKEVAEAKEAPRARVQHRSFWSAGAFLMIALAVISAPRRPIDVAPRAVSIDAPPRIGASAVTPLALTAMERAYFEQYGGVAIKAAYGQHALMLARTTSPLRHLHAPDECLRGIGYQVAYLGMRFDPVPSAQYRAVAPDGRAYRVEVSFLSDRGHRAASVSEAVWLWLQDRRTVWTAIQRITAEGASAYERAAFDAGVFAALDLPINEGGSHAR
jgi:exosortase/archaeosortase family protein